MTTVHDVAAYVLAAFDSAISTMKLQKLCYMAQGWNLALADRPLFDQEFEAWKRGPVSRDLYAQHRRSFSVEKLPRGDRNALSASDIVVVDAMLKNYGALSGVELSELTHEEGTPWNTVRQQHRVSPGAASTAVIDKALIKVHFKFKLGLPF